MRLLKEVVIDDKITFTCYEIRPKDLIYVYNKSKESGNLKESIFEDLLPKLTNATREEIENLYPNEIEMLLEGVKECNRPFLERLKILTKLPEIKELIEDVKVSMLKEFSDVYANLRRQDIQTQ